MSEDKTEDQLIEEQALDALKAQATQLGIQFHPSIGAEKLREKITAFLAAKEADKPVTASAETRTETENEFRQRIIAEQTRLVRVRITCMNPAKREWEGEIFTVGNAVIGMIKKYVPYNAPDGWHIPQIMLDMLREKKCQVFVNEKTKNGVTVRRGQLIPEFNIEILPDLTPEQLKDLAQQQAMANRV